MWRGLGFLKSSAALAACAAICATNAYALDAVWTLPTSVVQGPRLTLTTERPTNWVTPQDTGEFEVYGRASQAYRAEKMIDGQAILLRLAPSQADQAKGRWFVYAAGSGKAFGLNLMRDPQDGWRRAGWSVERMAEVGKLQMGVGWREGSTQVSLSATRRELGVWGFSRDDSMVGINLSMKPSR